MWAVIYMDGDQRRVAVVEKESAANTAAERININAYLRGEPETAEVVEVDSPSEE